jgi:5-methylcytosine-specific restriction endonuclease McrBC regulatory subunit McrC
VLVQVQERGSATLVGADIAELQDAPEFWALVDRGILSSTLLPGGRVRLEAGPYVGRCRCGGSVLEIVEKIPGALRSLLAYASGSAFRLEAVTGLRTELGPLVALVVRAFLTDTRAYLTAGKEFRYARRRERGSLVGGAIDVAGTARLRARGLPHLIVFDRPIVSHETDKNIILKRALREIDHIASVVSIESADIVQARALGMYFDDADHLATRPRLEVAYLAEQLASSDPSHGDLLSLAAILLRHESFELGEWLGETTPRSWFINLERLFEDALMRELNRVHYAGIEGRRGAAMSRSIFLPPEFSRADPDFVLMQDGGIVGVGDAKYKAWTGDPSRADLYQLLVHGASFASPVCFLAYAHDSFASSFIGQSVTGAATYAFAIDVNDLTGGVLRMLRQLDAPTEEPT